MTPRVWLGTILILAAILLPLRDFGSPAVLLSQHGHPASVDPTGDVWVTPEGRVFHRPGCLFMHGPSQSIPGSEAKRRGYVPCVRCEAELIR